MAINKVSMSIEQAIQILEILAGNHDVEITKTEENGNTIQISFSNKTLIRIYSTKRGLTIDASGGKNTEFGEQLLVEFQSQGYQQVRGGITVYTVNEEQKREVLTEKIKTLSQFEIKDVKIPQHASSCLEIKHPERSEKVTLTQFKSGKLTVQGVTWEVWDAVCTLIEQELNASVVELVSRFILEDPNERIVGIVTSGIEKRAHAELSKKILGPAYTFLWNHDKKCLVSSICLKNVRLDLPEYFAYVSPAGKALEGYLKKSLISTGHYTEADIQDRSFNFSHVFNNGGGTCTIQGDLSKYLISVSNPSQRAKKEAAFIRLYAAVKKYRHQYFHSNPPAAVLEVPDYETASDLIEDILDIIRSVHPDLH